VSALPSHYTRPPLLCVHYLDRPHDLLLVLVRDIELRDGSRRAVDGVDPRSVAVHDQRPLLFGGVGEVSVAGQVETERKGTVQAEGMDKGSPVFAHVHAEQPVAVWRRNTGY